MLRHEVIAKEIDLTMMEQRIVKSEEPLKAKDLFNFLSVLPEDRKNLIEKLMP